MEIFNRFANADTIANSDEWVMLRLPGAFSFASFWTAVAERSGDTAFVRAKGFINS